MKERVINIKRCFLLGICLSLALSVVCSAVDYDAYYYQNEDGTRGHDTETYEHDLAVEMLAERGFSLDVSQYWYIDDNSSEILYLFDFEGFLSDYDAIVAALPLSVIPDPTEPVVEEPDVIDDVVIDEITDPVSDPVLEVPESDPVLELEEDLPMVYTLNDLRSPDPVDDGLVDGLKAVVRSVFGTYQPNMTTAAITETVDGETVTTLVDVVASGSAGVDYEYLSGVFLFGIMLFCLFKLLGGILS